MPTTTNEGMDLFALTQSLNLADAARDGVESPKKKRVVNRRTREHIRVSRGDFARIVAKLKASVATEVGTADFAVLSALIERLSPVCNGITKDNVMQEVTVSY